MNRVKLLSAALLCTVIAAPALAQHRPMGGAYDDPFGPRLRGSDSRSAEPSRRIDVSAFRAAEAGALGKGPVVVAAATGTGDDGKLPVYEAAVVDQLAHLGYDTATSSAEGGQLVQVAISHAVVVPEEGPKKPVSGAMAVSVGNRGTSTTLALGIDLSKPRKAIVSTRLDVRIRDKASGRVLWEGQAIGQSRAGDEGIDDGAVAARLAAALFARFPEGTVVEIAG